ncbi:hypothetical protein Cob_v010645 [Colletotrichum orbiculare MAFF 240422]|uniref:Rhodopsin domain-containing protein n=1 Tax=Colletotrichum orbiculare (strain 104-T / ATCC 96160 / CBS 514.97 / LARS 414 / MAFF 240422) TaxID=1213857 RepID=N4VQK8_COLOR|nr:hypothetical protein Cob_v010645 [Colletotrichum orbiculare MAFF 240422]
MSSSTGAPPRESLTERQMAYSAVNHVSPGMLTAVIWTSFSVATLFLMLRLFVRWRDRKRSALLLDDYWMIFAWLCLVALAIVQMNERPSLYYIARDNAGQPQPQQQHVDDPNATVEQWRRLSFACNFMFWTTLYAVKASLLTTFYHCVSPNPCLRRFWFLVAATVAVTYVAGMVTAWTACGSDVSNFFRADRCKGGYWAWRAKVTIYVAATFDILTDLMIILLPVSLLPTLRLDKKKKIGLGVAFSLVFVTVCVCIVRMSQTVKGPAVDLVGLTLWSFVEAAAAVLVGSLPPLKALFTRKISEMYCSRRNRTCRRFAASDKEAGTCRGYDPSTTSRSVMVAESIPLDEMHRSGQTGGGIYVQRTCEWRVERVDEASNSEASDVQIVAKGSAV